MIFRFNNKDTEERYDESKFIKYNEGTNSNDDGYEIMNSKFFMDLGNISPSSTTKVSYQINRPDIISYEIYENIQYWWILLEYNKISSPDEIQNALLMYFPSLLDIEDLYFRLKTGE